MYYANKTTIISKTKLFYQMVCIKVHCEWTDWNVGDCSTSCGNGTRTNNRTTKISAAHGGKECEGSHHAEEICHVKECPGSKLLSPKVINFNPNNLLV